MVKQAGWWAVFLAITIWFAYLLQHQSAWGGWLLFTPEGRKVLAVLTVGLYLYLGYRRWRQGERWVACLTVFAAALIVYNHLN